MSRNLKVVNSSSAIPDDPNLTEVPEWLSESQKAGWRHAIDSAPKGLLLKIDAALLTIWVVAEDFHREAAEKLRIEGLARKAVNGFPMQSLYLSILNQQAGIMMKVSSSLGFSPASREKLNIQPESDPNNPWAKFT